MNNATPLENGARAYVQYIEDRIQGALSPAAAEAVTPADKASLERSLDALRPSFDELAKRFFDPVREQKPDMCEHGYCMLWRLMGGAFNAGARGIVSDSAQKYTNRVKALKGPRSKKKAERLAGLKRFLQEHYPHNWVKTREFAEQIRPAILTYLGVKEVRGPKGLGYGTKEPTVETIYQDLRRIDFLEKKLL